MPPRKKEPVVIPDFKDATSEFEFNTGFRYGLSDNPPHLEEVPIPYGAPHCLDGITFTITGTLPSITREDAKELIERHGGRVTTSISGRTDVLLRGSIEVGPKKLQDAKARGIKIIDQDSLFDYLKSTNPSYKPPPPKKIEGGVELPVANFPKSSLLTEKYRPRYLRDIVGNLSGIKHLIKFFDDFVEKGDKGSAILSGPPGIGKSTCATLVALLKGYEPIEFNASDTRSKKAIGEDISDVFSNHSLKGNSNLHCLIFDEIDGMSTGDRGGLQALVKLVDKTSIPVICICNDRNDKKLQTLANHSVDIKFTKPTPEDVSDRLRFIADQEKIDATDDQLLSIARASNGDIRHAINTLQFWTKAKDDDDKISPSDKDGKVVPLTDVVDACQKALMPTSTIDERFENYFVDYGIMPLYIYENLPAVEGNRHEYSNAMDSISISDNIQNLIRDSNIWNLLNADALFSTVIPGFESKGKGFGVSVRFPQYLGKLNKHKRLNRCCIEISSRSINSASIYPNDLYDTTAPLLTELFTYLAKENKKDPEPFVDFLESLCLTLSDYENLYEIVMLGGDSKNPRKIPIPPKLKTAITQFYHTKHTDDPKVAKAMSEVQSDYYIKSRARGKFSKSSKKRKSSRVSMDDDDDEYDSYDYYDSYNGNEEEDGDYNPNQKKEKKIKAKEKTSKSKSQPKPKAKSRSKSKPKYSSEDEDDDEDDDLDGFIVDDSDYDDAPKSKPKKSKSQSTYKPKKTVIKKKPQK